jgi:hypothetical protein
MRQTVAFEKGETTWQLGLCGIEEGGGGTGSAVHVAPSTGRSDGGGRETGEVQGVR